MHLLGTPYDGLLCGEIGAETFAQAVVAGFQAGDAELYRDIRAAPVRASAFEIYRGKSSLGDGQARSNSSVISQLIQASVIDTPYFNSAGLSPSG